MELHRYPQEKPKKYGFYLVYLKTGNGYWDVIQWSSRKWSDWSEYANCYYYPTDVEYWCELPEIPEEI